MNANRFLARFVSCSFVGLSIFLALALTRRTNAAAHSAIDLAQIAPTPPMGWNSWDAYGEAVPESDVRASADFMAANLKSFGWQYITVDMGWYVTNHSVGVNAENAEFNLDEFGRFTPAPNTIPSARDNAGFKPLGDYIHSLGLKFGIHILRGIPRQAVKQNLPIAGSSFHAADAADTADTCPWNPFNYGLKTATPAAQAYYDSIAGLYADWGVDLIKVDCISSHPYKGEDIRMLREALNKSGRPILLSLSPGPAPLEKAKEMAKYANIWRMSDDVWDVWQSDKGFPQGPRNQFERAAKWAAHSGNGHWPDADMLPLGSLRPTPGWGEPRETRLTPDEQRTLLTLWCVARSPLIMGGSLVALRTTPPLSRFSPIPKPSMSINTPKRAMLLAQPPPWLSGLQSRSPEAGLTSRSSIFRIGHRRSISPWLISVSPKAARLSVIFGSAKIYHLRPRWT